ncbi:THAP domain-containing protein 1-like isoform X3 [Leptopilina heterotoma]|uniref:THAP domain-containing protein 1-like isoform X3 n=1 Tax=Leptopilina heterotoma TaxID=63436 RepID=UPI001CA7B884|nr:THAP domain-containing protein 1-like isoform X3 [Leptopilina heterotoma]
MVLVCLFCGKKEAKGVSFHKFPRRTELCQMWIKNMGFDENFEITAHNRLCSDHFNETCFTKETNERERIHSESIPTKFGRYYLQCICCSNVKRIGCNIIFRKFPFKNRNLLKIWIEKIGLENFCPNERSLICDEHFTEHCFYKRKEGGLILKSNAFPTLFSSNMLNDTDSPLESTSILENEQIVAGPTTPEKNSCLSHDHHYHSSPKGLMEKYTGMREKLQKSMKTTYQQKQVIKRLQKKVSTLSSILLQVTPNIEAFLEDEV